MLRCSRCGVVNFSRLARRLARSLVYYMTTLPATSGPPSQPLRLLNRYGFDTGAFVDVCVADFGTPNTLDTETGAALTYITSAQVSATTGTSITLPISNKTGLYVGDTATIAGVVGILTVTTFTATGVTFSMSSQTTAIIPISTQLFLLPQPSPIRPGRTKPSCLFRTHEVLVKAT